MAGKLAQARSGSGERLTASARAFSRTYPAAKGRGTAWHGAYRSHLAKVRAVGKVAKRGELCAEVGEFESDDVEGIDDLTYAAAQERAADRMWRRTKDGVAEALSGRKRAKKAARPATRGPTGRAHAYCHRKARRWVWRPSMSGFAEQETVPTRRQWLAVAEPSTTESGGLASGVRDAETGSTRRL